MAILQIPPDQQNSLEEICAKHYVVALDIFGSALTDHFGPESDLDFVVQFAHVPPEEYADNFFGFRDALSALFKRKIDLVEVQTLKNNHFKEVVERTKQPIYARG